MTGAKLAAAKAAAKAFLVLVELPRDRVGVVAFNQRAQVLSALSGEMAELTRAIDEIRPAPGTRIDRGLEEALRVLPAGQDAESRQRVVVLLTDGRQYEAPGSALEVARQARQDGVVLFGIGLGDDVDLVYLAELVGSERCYHAPHEGELAAMYEAIARRIPCPPERYWGRR
jgi:Mg-chelatase subunit ChlD